MNQAVQAAVEHAGGQSELARKSGNSQQQVWNWLNSRPVPPDRCPSLERAVGGQVVCEALRPDVRWARVPDPDWPHPMGRPCIDVAANSEPATAAEPKAA